MDTGMWVRVLFNVYVLQYVRVWDYSGSTARASDHGHCRHLCLFFFYLWGKRTKAHKGPSSCWLRGITVRVKCGRVNDAHSDALLSSLILWHWEECVKGGMGEKGERGSLLFVALSLSVSLSLSRSIWRVCWWHGSVLHFHPSDAGCLLSGQPEPGGEKLTMQKKI